MALQRKYAFAILLGILSLALLFHLCILIKLIPYQITWGGRLTNDTEMYVFETISISVNLLLMLVVFAKANYIRPFLSEKIMNIVLWFFVAVYLLNTIGNLFAKTLLEKSFSLLTLVLAYLIWQILRKQPTS
jgi:hypothetical protein